MVADTSLFTGSRPTSKRRRGTDKSGRRFSAKDSSKRQAGKKHQLPSPATLPRKAQRANHVFRLMITGALFFVLMSTISSWRARAQQRRSQGFSHHTFTGGKFSLSSFFRTRFRRKNRTRIAEDNSMTSALGRNESLEVQEGEAIAAPSNETESVQTASIHPANEDENSNDGENVSDSHVQTEISHAQEEAPLSFEDLPERIEWYTRDDFKDGTRPMCRISKPYILSNGTILVPDWMAGYEKLLVRCGLGAHSFYSTEQGPSGLERTRDIAADFALTVHLERFQEPTHDPSVYLTEHILKSSYLFDVFGGDARGIDGVREHHCYTTPNDSTCNLPRPTKTLMKPAIFVPKKVETSEQHAWTRQLVDMFGTAHGHGHEAIHLNTSTLVIKSQEGQSEGLTGTCFRSILTTDGMFRHLPAKGLEHSNFYSTKNGIHKRPKTRTSDNCNLSIGISQPADASRGIEGIPDLKEKIDVLSKLAIVGSTIETKIVSFGQGTSLEDHIKEMQDLDIYIGSSGDEMSSIGFLRSSSAVMELMPFGVKPNTHESLARVLGLPYESYGGKPQIDAFKRCIDGEIFSLRKRGKVSFTETPEWYEPLIKAWDAAVSESVLSGRSDFNLLTAEAPVKNYHSRVCASKQKVEIDMDQVARKIVLSAKERCSGAQSTS